MSTTTPPEVICVGSVLWDIIGRSPDVMRSGADVPGRIVRLPGGVAMNVAMTLRRLGLSPTLLTAIGKDAAGDELVEICARLRVGTEYVYRASGMPTDRYLAIEDANGLIAAIADAHSLEAAGDKILLPLTDGRLGSAAKPWSGLMVLDGNLTEALLAEIAQAPFAAAADLRIVPASPGKVARLRPLLAHPRATLYVNLEEACLLGHHRFEDSASAARGLLAAGARRVLVTDGARDCSDGKAGEEVLTDRPPAVEVNRVTGAGDTFMAAHIIAEKNGLARLEALVAAHKAASDYVSQEIGT
ncbi:MAG: kinase [Lacunisphaera sp.]|nr:kinase [Lacunisphaera sp.]